jgi:allophanate hydrolase subunit 1
MSTYRTSLTEEDMQRVIDALAAYSAVLPSGNHERYQLLSLRGRLQRAQEDKHRWRRARGES